MLLGCITTHWKTFNPTTPDNVINDCLSAFNAMLHDLTQSGELFTEEDIPFNCNQDHLRLRAILHFTFACITLVKLVFKTGTQATHLLNDEKLVQSMISNYKRAWGTPNFNLTMYWSQIKDSQHTVTTFDTLYPHGLRWRKREQF